MPHSNIHENQSTRLRCRALHIRKTLFQKLREPQHIYISKKLDIGFFKTHNFLTIILRICGESNTEKFQYRFENNITIFILSLWI